MGKRKITKGEWMAIVVAIAFAVGIGMVAYFARDDLKGDELIVPETVE